MSGRRVKKDVRDQMRHLGEMFESMKDRHLDPANQVPRSNFSLAVGLIPHIIIFVFATSVIWVAKPSSSLFSWHPTLMSLAYTVLMSEAILLFSSWSSPIMHVGNRSVKVQWHWILQGCAAVCSFTGVVIITANKMINGHSHYTSYHSILGIFLSGFVFIQISGGILEKYPDILPFKVRLVTLKRLHAMFGVLTYSGGLTTLFLGLFSSWFVANADPYLWKICVACPCFLAVAVFVQLIKNHFWRW